MFPNSIQHNVRNNSLVYLKFLGQFFLKYAASVIPGTYFSHLTFTKLFSTIRLATLKRMDFVLGRGDPFKVVYSIIHFVRISVVYLSQLTWVGYEGLCNEPMYQKLTRLFTLVKHNCFVAAIYKPGFNESASIVTPNPTIFAYSVKSFITFNISHGIITIPRLYPYGTSNF